MKTISFDLDGTLSDLKKFEELFWYGEIPRLYAIKNNIDFEKAKRIVIGEYDKVGSKKLEWYIPSYWLDYFKLEKNFDEIMANLKSKLIIYPEVKESIDKLSKKYDIIVITKSPVDISFYKLEVENIINNIKHIFSITSQFNSVEKSKEIYVEILNYLKISNEELLHCGDDFNCDYLNPKKAGIRAFYLDRKKEINGKDIIHDLSELEERLDGF